MKIYFDGILVDEDNYMSYSDNFSSFEDVFYLGSTSSLQATLQIPLTAWPGTLDEVRIEVDGNAIATLKLDDITVNDDESITLSLVDILTHTSTECDFSSLITYQKTYDPETDTWTETGTGITAKELLDFICSVYGIYKEDFDFTNQNVMIYSYDSTLTGRNYLEMIAELAGGYLSIDEWGTLSIKYYNRDSINLWENDNYYTLLPEEAYEITETGFIFTRESVTGGKYISKRIHVENGKKYVFSSDITANPAVDCYIIIYRGNVYGTAVKSSTTGIIYYDSTADEDLFFTFIFNSSLLTATVNNIQVEINTVNERSPWEPYGKTFNPKKEDVLTYEDVDTYKLSEEITIQRVVYDNGITTPKKSSDDENLYTLYLSTENLFLQTITDLQFENICNNIIGYRFFNIEIKTCNRFFEKGSTIWFQREDDSRVPIIVNYSREYLGGFTGEYKTKISNAKKTETQVIPTETKIQKLKTIINQMDNSLTIEAEKTTNLQRKTSQLRIDIDKVQSLFQITGGSNLIRNSQFLLPDETWEFTEATGDPLVYHTPIGEGYNSSLIGETVAVANIILRNSKATTEINNIKISTVHNINYYLSQDTNTTSYVRLISKTTSETIFEDIITTDSTHTIDKQNYSHSFTANDSDYILEIETSTVLSGYVYIYDLMFNSGDKKSWEPAASEVYSTILKMSQQGFQVYSSGSNILTLITSDGFQVREARDSGDGGIILGRIVSRFNSEGIITEIVRMTKAVIGTYIQEELTLNNIIHHVEYFEE